MTKFLDALFVASVVVVAVALLFAEPTVYLFAVVLLGIAVIFGAVIGWRHHEAGYGAEQQRHGDEPI